MESRQTEFILRTVAEASARSVAEYIKFSGETIDQMPEFVMSMGASLGLRTCNIPTLLEVNATTIRRRLAQGLPDELVSKIDSALNVIGYGRLDLVVLGGEDGGQLKHSPPIGFIEFKRWRYDTNDAFRVRSLVNGIPDARFGACVFLRNSAANDLWIQRLRDEAGPAESIIASDVIQLELEREPHCIVCAAQLREQESDTITAA